MPRTPDAVAPADPALGTSVPPGGLRSDFGWAVRQLSMAFQDLGSAAVAHLPQGARGYLVLVAVADGDKPSQLDLVNRLAIDKTSMTRLIDALEDGGLVVRRADAADRRTRRIDITPKGGVALARARSQLADVETELLSPLTPTERGSFRDLLGRVAGGVGPPPACMVD